jgi:hypothetical protein
MAQRLSMKDPERGDEMELSSPAEHAVRAANIMEEKRIAIIFFIRKNTPKFFYTGPTTLFTVRSIA